MQGSNLWGLKSFKLTFIIVIIITTVIILVHQQVKIPGLKSKIITYYCYYCYYYYYA